MKPLIVAFVLAFMFFGANAVRAQEPKKETPKQKVKPAPAEETQEPSAAWLKDFDDYQALGKVVQRHREQDKDEQDLAALENTLRTKLPQGFTFNPATRKFVKLPVPPAQPPAAPAK
jgi:hypothetical protein